MASVLIAQPISSLAARSRRNTQSPQLRALIPLESVGIRGTRRKTFIHPPAPSASPMTQGRQNLLHGQQPAGAGQLRVLLHRRAGRQGGTEGAAGGLSASAQPHENHHAPGVGRRTALIPRGWESRTSPAPCPALPFSAGFTPRIREKLRLLSRL